MPDPSSVLEDAYELALSREETFTQLTPQQRSWVFTITANAESQKAVLAALMTSLTKKIVSPHQDIRQHKMELEQGYSGRVFDTAYVTPFIRRKFPRLAMKSGSGWLTRSIEQVAPFTLNFPGRIANTSVKNAFLQILNDVEENHTEPKTYLVYLLMELIALSQRNPQRIQTMLESASVVPVGTVMNALKDHFFFNYGASGASRLPVIAIYSVYQLLIALPRYEGRTLAALKSHTTSDTKSRTIGDVEVLNKDGSFFEAVEIKHEIPISVTMIDDVLTKIENRSVSRYYLLTTADPNTLFPELVASATARIYSETQCEIIVNGLVPSLKYYLRLVPDPAAFIDLYTQNLYADYSDNTDIKSVHVERWNEIQSLL